ncbi:hypothetical protein D9M69_321200 [compost metagenome]
MLGLENPRLQLRRLDQKLDVLAALEEARVDHRRLQRVAAAQGDAADALRAQHLDVAAVAVAPVQLAAVVVDHRGDEDHLQVGLVQRRVGAQEGPGLGEVGGQQAAALARPFHGGGRQLEAAAHGEADAAFRAVDLVGHGVVDVVLQVLADAGQVHPQRNAQALQLGGRADAGEHQRLRRAEGAGGEDHLAPRAHFLDLLAVVVAHPDAARALEDQAVEGGVEIELEVGTLQVGPQVALGRAAALAVLLGDLVAEAAILLAAVVVLGAGDALRLGGAHEHLAQRAGRLQLGDVQRTAGAVELALAETLVVLGLLEVRQHLVVAPAGVAQARPVVVVPAVATHVDHAVDRAGTAQRLAARLVALAPVEARLRHRLVGPVVIALAHHHHDAGRRLDQHLPVAAAGLEQAHADLRVLAQARRNRTATRPATDHHVIEHLLTHIGSPQGFTFGSALPRYSFSARFCGQRP